MKLTRIIFGTIFVVSAVGCFLYLGRHLPAIDSNSVREWAAPVIAFLSFFVAVLAHKRGNREARLKDEESIARNEETKKYAQTLENFSRAAQFAKHLQGMDERAGTIAGHLETVAAKSSKITETATNQIEKSLEHLRKSTVAIEEIARQLRDIAKAAAAAQRQAITGKQRDDSPR